MNNFYVIGGDTDATWFGKKDGSPFSKEEISSFIENINKTFPENIKFDLDGYFSRFIVLKAKNYIMYDGNKIKLKGSSLKSSTLEPFLKSMLQEMIEAIVYNKQNHLVSIYHKYIKEVLDIKDITKYVKKITISTATINSQRANETRVIDVLKRSNKPIIEGDKHYIYFKTEKEMELLENFDGVYDKDTMIEKLFKTTERFSSILPTKELFLNYSLKRNKEKLGELSW